MVQRGFSSHAFFSQCPGTIQFSFSKISVGNRFVEFGARDSQGRFSCINRRFCLFARAQVELGGIAWQHAGDGRNAASDDITGVHLDPEKPTGYRRRNHIGVPHATLAPSLWKPRARFIPRIRSPESRPTNLIASRALWCPRSPENGGASSTADRSRAGESGLLSPTNSATTSFTAANILLASILTKPASTDEPSWKSNERQMISHRRC